jgi:uncharacterized membrane protein
MSDSRPSRRGYLDWLRGVAVVVMIGAHTIDAWTVTAEKTSTRYWYVSLVAGMAAPLFLFLAGVSVSLASGSKVRRGLTRGEAARAMFRRGLWIWVLALLFRVQSFLVSPGSTLYGILKVDILNIMGPAIAGAALLWGLASTLATRMALFVSAALVFGLATPIVRASTLVGGLPDPVEWYLRPWAGRTTFTLFPWAGFVFAGAALGLVIDRIRSDDGERRMNVGFAAAGVAVSALSFGLSYLPSPYASSQFWTSSPSFFFLRVGLLIVSVSLAYAWAQRAGSARFSPLRQFGLTSLFIYWIHVELAYGIASYPLHHALPLELSLVAFVLFTLLMLGASLLKTHVVRRWRMRGHGTPTVALERSGLQA